MAGIYKAYDIRGTTDELSEELAYSIGRAFTIVTKSQGKTLLVGHDMRPTSEPFAQQVIRGITDEGAHVLFAGMVSTPLFYYAARSVDGGVMITASHNPPEYNGFKFVIGNLPFSYATGINEIEQMLDEGLAEVPDGIKGGVTEKEFLDEFLDFNLGFLKTTKPMRIVVDAGNGMGGMTYKKLTPLLKDRGITVDELYFELDGTFPNHEANPLKLETLEDLKVKVKSGTYTLGLALDGDGDRCVFIDETGEHITSDLAYALVAEQLLKTRKGVYLHDLRFTHAVREMIADAGSEALPTPVGYANIKPLANERDAVFAGEISGHFFPKETGYNENTMFMLFQVLNLLEDSGKPLSALVAPLRKYAFSGEINSRVADADTTLAAVEEAYATEPGASVSHLDGVKIEFPTWWFSLRKSNTEPVVRLIVEAKTEEEMVARRDELLGLIR